MYKLNNHNKDVCVLFHHIRDIREQKYWGEYYCKCSKISRQELETKVKSLVCNMKVLNFHIVSAEVLGYTND